MRVTINFDVAASRAMSAMMALIVAESDYISEALVRLSNVNLQNSQSTAQQVADGLEQVVVQLKQYARMLSDLDKLANQQNLPQPADLNLSVDPTESESQADPDITEALNKLKNQVSDIKDFTNFMEKAASESSQEG